MFKEPIKVQEFLDNLITAIKSWKSKYKRGNYPKNFYALHKKLKKLGVYEKQKELANLDISDSLYPQSELVNSKELLKQKSKKLQKKNSNKRID